MSIIEKFEFKSLVRSVDSSINPLSDVSSNIVLFEFSKFL